MSAFSYKINKENVAILTFDLPGEKVNKLTMAVMEELDRILDDMASNKEIRSLVFRSGKEGSFIVGADITEIRNITDSDTAEHISRKGQAVMSKLESLPFPTVAAIHGPCMGGGLELALACTYRIISNDQKTALALPEVKLGIIPGFGGTQRLPRIIGLANALKVILTGESLFAQKALKMGLVDEITFSDILLERAISLAISAAGKPHFPAIRAKRTIFIRFLESTPLMRTIIYRSARNTVLRTTRGNYPAPLIALKAVKYGMAHKSEVGYANEARLLGSLATTEISKNLISVFYLRERLRKDLSPPSAIIRNAGVFGAGIMGGGIAQLFGEKGIEVRMKDINHGAVASGLREAWQIFRRRRNKGILTAIQARDGFDRISGATDFSGFGKVDLAVEAVVENMNVKKSVLRDFEAVATEGAIYASNTSSLSITDLALGSKHPERVVGMHFFNPVEKMPLVEVIRGKKTSMETTTLIAALARRLGKLPVLVNDGPGFLVNRILMPYLNEAVSILEQGSTIEKIDDALLSFGMPMGAFILLDEIGIDVAHKVADILQMGLGDRVKPTPLLETLYKGNYHGKKNGKGFYRYERRKRKGPDRSIYTLIPAGHGGSDNIKPEEIVDRTMLLMIKEAALCLEEHIIDGPDLLDGALIFGIGFPPFRGGLLRYADKLGVKTIIDKLEIYGQKYGERFRPPRSLLEMAEMGRGFYDKTDDRRLKAA
jgi:3-hydroxyacyl-CoA dehydrogenase/enoyl-CoA hydratase/3-hydroxybutyryl-CoA epimerase